MSRPNLPRSVKVPTPVDSPKTPSTNDIRELIRSNKDVLQSIHSIKEEIASFRRCVSSLEEKVERFESSLAALHERQTKCESEIKSTKLAVENLRNAQSTSTMNILDEVEQRQQRMNNLMIFGMPETTEGSLVDRRRLDENNILDLFSETGAIGIPPVTVRRVGKIIEGQSR